jgi:hypothetical protein
MKRNFIGSKGAMRHGCLRVTTIHNFFIGLLMKKKETNYVLINGWRGTGGGH